MASSRYLRRSQNLLQTVSGAVLTASSASTSYPVTNIRSGNYAEPWRSTGKTSEWFKIDFGSAKDVTTIALGNVNISSAATVTIRWNTSDSWPGAGSETFTLTQLLAPGSTQANGVRNLYHNLSATRTYRWWRIEIADSTNDNAFLEIGEVGIGVDEAFTDMFSDGWSRKLRQNNVELQTDYGQEYVYDRDYLHDFDFAWSTVTQETMLQLRQLYFSQRKSLYAFFFCLNPNSYEIVSNGPALAYYVRIASDLDENYINHNVYNVRMALREQPPGIIVPR